MEKSEKNQEKSGKRVLTSSRKADIINTVAANATVFFEEKPTEMLRASEENTNNGLKKSLKKDFKKVLTNDAEYDIL